MSTHNIYFHGEIIKKQHLSGQSSYMKLHKYRISTGWLEPFLDRVATGEPLIVAPVINTVFKDTFAVDGSPLNDLGGVHLETLEFKWLPLSEER